MKLEPLKPILVIAMIYFTAKWRKLEVREALASVAVISISYVTFTYFKKNKAKLYYQQNERNKAIIEGCPSIKAQKYQPPFLF